MKIACLIRSLTLGGAERQMMGLCNGLSAAGHDVTLIIYHDIGFYSRDLVSSEVKIVLMKKFTSIGFSARLAGYLKREGTEVLVAFLPGPATKACLAKILYPGFRLVVSERNFNLRYLPHDSIRFNLFRLADRVVCNSHAQTGFVLRHCSWLNGKVSTIVNFAPLDEFVPSEERPSGSVKRIAVAARLCSRKNPMGLVDAAARLKDRGFDFRIEWYGAEDDGYRARVEKEIRRRGLDGCFSLMPATEKIADVYRSSDLFCLPSYYEGTSNAMAEALCCGLPLVVTRVSDSPLYVNDGENGFLCRPGDSESLAEAIGRALSLSAEDAEIFGRRSRERAEAAFSKDAFIDSWQNLLKQETNR